MDNRHIYIYRNTVGAKWVGVSKKNIGHLKVPEKQTTL